MQKEKTDFQFPEYLSPAFPSTSPTFAGHGLSKREYAALKILQTFIASDASQSLMSERTIHGHIVKSIQIADKFIMLCQEKDEE